MANSSIVVGYSQDNPLKTLAQSYMKHLQESKHVRVLVVSCKILRGVRVVVRNHVNVDTMFINTKCDTVLTTMVNRTKKPIFGNVLPTLRLWLVLLTEMLAAFEGNLDRDAARRKRNNSERKVV